MNAIVPCNFWLQQVRNLQPAGDKPFSLVKPTNDLDPYEYDGPRSGVPLACESASQTVWQTAAGYRFVRRAYQELGAVDLVRQIVFVEERRLVLRIRDAMLSEIKWLDDKNCDIARGAEVLYIPSQTIEEIEEMLIAWSNRAVRPDDAIIEMLLDRSKLWRKLGQVATVRRPATDIGKMFPLYTYDPDCGDRWRSPWYLTAPRSILNRRTNRQRKKPAQVG